MRANLLLTGATGLIGRYLLLEFLQRGEPLAVLVRSRNGRSGRDRMEAIVAELERDLGTTLPRPVCLEGDICHPGLGLSVATRQWVRRNCGRLLHNAASVTFDGNDRGQEPWRSNLLGAGHVIEFAAESSIDELHWVSTAYVCGRRKGAILESELDCGQEFRNSYEQSKFEAERLLRQATLLNPPTIYRPSIVVGDSRTGYTNSYHNVYLFLKFTHILSQTAQRDADGRWRHPVRLTFSGEEQLNLAPVDWVAKAISRLALDRRSHGKTYHLAHPRPTTCGVLEEALSRYFNYYGVEFVGRDGICPGTATDVEQMFYHSLAAHDSYWNAHPQFDCSNTLAALSGEPCPQVDVPNLLQLFDFAVQHDFGRRSKARRPRSSTGNVAVDV